MVRLVGCGRITSTRLAADPEDMPEKLRVLERGWRERRRRVLGEGI